MKRALIELNKGYMFLYVCFLLLTVIFSFDPSWDFYSLLLLFLFPFAMYILMANCYELKKPVFVSFFGFGYLFLIVYMLFGYYGSEAAYVFYCGLAFNSLLAFNLVFYLRR